MTDDQRDAARWRKIAQYLRLEVERDESWQRESESNKKRVEVKVTEWKWQLDVHPDHSWQLYGTTTDESQVPKSLDDFIDGLPDKQSP